MTIISPSLLACDFLNIEPELNAFNGIKDMWFHLDIMDGHFVPNLTFGHPIIELILKKSTHKCDAHFMVTNPAFYGETLKNSGLHNFTFHLEATPDSLGLIKELKRFFPSVGISIKPNTPTNALTNEILKAIDLVLVMSVEPGFGGQSFMPSSLERIEKYVELKNLNQYNYLVGVDGGINGETSTQAKHAGANVVVAGSYVFSEDIEKAIQTLL